MEVNQQAVRLLEAAEKLMNDEGRHWIKGTYHRYLPGSNELGYCSVGAIKEIAERENFTELVRFKAQKVLASVVDPKGEFVLTPPDSSYYDHDRIAAWNDDQRRVWSDVTSAFQQAREKLLSK